MEVLQQWGQHRVEVRYRLRQLPAPAGSRAAGLVVSRTPAENTVGVVAGAVSLEAKASANPEVPCVPGAGGPTPGLPERPAGPGSLATAAHQQPAAAPGLQGAAAAPAPRSACLRRPLNLCLLQEQQLRCLEVREQQELSEQEHLRLLRENAHNQEAKLRRVRALRGQVEHKRLSNGKLGQCVRRRRLSAGGGPRRQRTCPRLSPGEEVQQMSQLLQQKQRELLLAASRVEQLSQQLEALRSSRPEAPPPPCRRELERLHREPQVSPPPRRLQEAC